MKIKEERDERKRAETIPIHNGSVTITPTAHIKTEGKEIDRKLILFAFAENTQNF